MRAARVTYNLDNVNKCQCYQCPVHQTSQCITNKMQTMGIHMPMSMLPSAEAFEGMYCAEAVSKSTCTDLDASKNCICPTCPVWSDNNLTMQYYCANGSQIERERKTPGTRQM